VAQVEEGAKGQRAARAKKGEGTKREREEMEKRMQSGSGGRANTWTGAAIL